MKSSKDAIPDHDSLKGYIAEVLGTFTLTFVSCWTVIACYEFSKDVSSSCFLVALAPALVTFAFLNFGTPSSQTTLNPALTLALVIMNKQSWSTGMKYVLLQLTGAVVAAGFIFIQLSKAQFDKLAGTTVLGIPVKGSAEYASSVLVGEFIGSFLLGYTYMSLFAGEASQRNAKVGSAAVALVLFLSLFCLSEVFGVGLNPARSLGPAIISGRVGKLQFEQVAGPVFGCLLGAILQVSIFVSDDEEEEEAREAADESQRKLRLDNGAQDVELEEK